MTNKNKVSADSLAAAETVMISVNKLVQQREQFEQNEYARSNACLYEILSGIYSNYQEASADRRRLTAVVKAMKNALTEQGSRVQSNTRALGLFVRYVFRTDRQRAYNYTCALQAALAANIPSVNLEQYFVDQGGLEECKKQFVKSEKTISKQQKISEAMPQVNEYLHSVDISVIAEFDVPPASVAKSVGEEFTFLLAKADSNGHVQVISAVPAFSKKFAKWAKQELALFLSEQQEIENIKAVDDRYSQAITNAAKQAKENSLASETVGELLAA